MRYGLAAGLSFCAIDRRLAFLDLARDRYFVLSGGCERAFRDFLESPFNASPAALNVLRSYSLISPNGSEPVACTNVRPTGSLLKNAHGPVLGHVAPAGFAYLRASWKLRHWGIARTVDHYSSLPLIADRDGEDDRRRGVVAGFEALRLVVDPTDRCLPLSFAMGYELKRQHCRSEVVFGITLDPFRAHCWAQFEDQVLNDRLDHVLDFQPILTL